MWGWGPTDSLEAGSQKYPKLVERAHSGDGSGLGPEEPGAPALDTATSLALCRLLCLQAEDRTGKEKTGECEEGGCVWSERKTLLERAVLVWNLRHIRPGSLQPPCSGPQSPNRAGWSRGGVSRRCHFKRRWGQSFLSPGRCTRKSLFLALALLLGTI